MKNWSTLPILIGPGSAAGGRARFWRTPLLVVLAIGLWVAASWVVVNRYQSGVTEAYLRRERVNAERDVRSITMGIGQNWDAAEGLLTSLSRQEAVVAALTRINRDDEAAGPTAARRNFRDDPEIAALSRSFFSTVNDLRIVSILALLDRRGDCIAASNGAALTSLIGNNYADRRYFEESRRGVDGAEFATGRATNQPGLFLAVPVLRDGAFLGALITKFDNASLAPWLNFADAIIADDNGVIILARDHNLLFKVIPNGNVGQLSEDERVALYKRSSFNIVPLHQWSAGEHPEIVKLDERPVPVMLVTAPMSMGKGVAGVMHPLALLPLLDRERWRIFALFALGGVVIELLLIFLVGRLRETLKRGRAAEHDAAFLQALLDSASLSMAVYGADGQCVAANDAMLRMIGLSRTMATKHNFRDNDLWLAAGMVASANQVISTGDPQRGHWQLTPVFGQELWVEAAMRRFAFRSRDFLLVIFVDVTEQHWRENQRGGH